MRTSQVASVLSSTIKARLPVLLTGAPGCAKTSLVEQAAVNAGAKLIISHPVVSDPTDAKGLPWPDPENHCAQFLPFGDLAKAMRATEPTVWLLDDLGQAVPQVQASFMNLILARRIGEHILPDCVTFIACTNRRQDRAGVQGILEPVKSRFTTIIEVEPNLDDWCEWAFDSGVIPAEMVAFLRTRPELLWQHNPSSDMTNSPCPRTWANVAALQNADVPYQFETFRGAVGEGAATEYVAFLAMYKSIVSIDSILLDPANADVPTEPSQLYAVSAGLAYRANETTFPRIAEYTERVNKAGFGEFSTLIIRDSIRRCPAIGSTPAFTKIVSGPIGALIAGSIVYSSSTDKSAL